MAFDESIVSGTALGVFEWTDRADPPAAGTAEGESESWSSRADSGDDSGNGGPAAGLFLTLDGDVLADNGDTFVFDGSAFPVLAAPSDPTPAETAGDDSATTALAGDPDVAGAAEAATAEVFPDWMEPDFDFLPTEQGTGPAADGAAPLATAAILAADEFGALEDFTGDFGPAPEEPAETPPPGDVIGFGGDEPPGTFIADDGSVVTPADLTGSDFLL